MSTNRTYRFLALFACLAFLGESITAAEPLPASRVSAEIDRLIDAEITASGGKPAPLTNDNDFLRRVTLDLADQLGCPPGE